MIFSHNPFRILGIQSTSGQREIKKNISKLNAYSKLGRKMEMDYDLSALNLSEIERTTEILQKSENKINLDKNKIKNSLFWFTDVTPIDSVALATLIKGDVNKSIEIWEKATKSKEVSLKNYSAFNNLSTLLFLNSLDTSRTDTFLKDNSTKQAIKHAINLKSEFLSSIYFNNYCEIICHSVSITSDEALEFFTSSILELLNKNFSPKDLSNLLSSLDNNIQDSINVSLSEVPITNIEHHIESADTQIKNDVKSGIKAGKQLIKDTLKDIKYLKDISSSDDFNFQAISDKLSNQILQCGIVCFNATGNDQDFMSSYKYALSIAHGDKTKKRAEDCVDHCEKEKSANMCSRCNSSPISNEITFSYKMYRETNRTWFPRRVEFQVATLNLYYCTSCSSEINADDSKINKCMWICGVIGAIFGLISLPGEDAVMIAIIFLGILGLGIGKLLGQAFFGKNKSAALRHPTLIKYKKDGWGTSKPSA